MGKYLINSMARSTYFFSSSKIKIKKIIIIIPQFLLASFFFSIHY